MRFLVTGASGFIGYLLALRLTDLYGRERVQLIVPNIDYRSKERERHKHLADAGFDIVVCDLLNDNLDVLAIKPFDVLFHLAAFTETETDSPCVHVNNVGTERLLNTLRPLLLGKRVVYTGTMASVDRVHPDNTPQAEDYPCTPRTIYGCTKLDAESILRCQAEQTGFEWTILRLPIVYGPGFRPGSMFDVLANSLCRGTLATRLAWPGRVSLVYVADVVDALVALGTEDAGRNALYHISSGENPQLDDLITRIAHILGLNRRRIAPPWPFWSLMRAVVWLPGLMSVLPFKLSIFVWRLSLVVTDGMVSDSTKLNQVLSLRYTLLDEGLTNTYGGKRLKAGWDET